MVDNQQAHVAETPHGEQSVLFVHSDRPIHSPGCIQPHGCLVVVSLFDGSILNVSENTSDFVGLPPQALLGQTIDLLLTSNQFETVCESLDSEVSSQGWVSNISIRCGNADERVFDIFAHRQRKRILLEFEPVDPCLESDTFTIQSRLSKTVETIQTSSDIQSLLDRVVEEVRHYTGFDRVLAYQFDDSGAGNVVAESNGEHFPSFLGLHFPAVDVPQEVRELYTNCHIRYVHDVDAIEIELLSAEDEALPGSTLDLTYAILRSPDPCSIQYLKNIGVTSLLFISLIYNGRLWGFVSCHNATVKAINSALLSTCELIGQIASMQLSNVSETEDRIYRQQLQSVRAEFIRATRDAETLEGALFQQGDLLLKMVGASGAAFCVDGNIALRGVTPTIGQVRELLSWLKTPAQKEEMPEEILAEDDVFATHHLASIYPNADRFTDTASGLLLLWISRSQNSAILWFRPELLHTIEWAGEPSESLTSNPDGTLNLNPRSSFELWKETVRMQSEPWKACEIDSANELRNSLVNLLIAKLEELGQINRELERSNRELDSFAYAASHDLKEPLRGIHNYSTFLLEDYSDQLDEGGIERLKTLLRLTHRMDSLIDVLLQFAQIGREELQIQPVDLNDTVQQAIELVTAGRRDISPTFTIPRALPTIFCDPLLMERVFSNLFSNALKYTNTSDIQVEVGFLTKDERLLPPPETFGPESLPSLAIYVKDNGIGIRKRHLKTIFRLFKRLHAPKKYGGGTGAGLTIVKKIVERHGGRIWVESEYGAGSTFFIADIE